MPSDQTHHAALIETARAELERTHRAACAMDAAEMRRGLELALTALQDAGDHADLAAELGMALGDLDAGRLEHMERTIESVRKALA